LGNHRICAQRGLHLRRGSGIRWNRENLLGWCRYCHVCGRSEGFGLGCLMPGARKTGQIGTETFAQSWRTMLPARTGIECPVHKAAHKFDYAARPWNQALCGKVLVCLRGRHKGQLGLQRDSKRIANAEHRMNTGDDAVFWFLHREIDLLLTAPNGISKSIHITLIVKELCLMRPHKDPRELGLNRSPMGLYNRSIEDIISGDPYRRADAVNRYQNQVVEIAQWLAALDCRWQRACSGHYRGRG